MSKRHLPLIGTRTITSPWGTGCDDHLSGNHHVIKVGESSLQIFWILLLGYSGIIDIDMLITSKGLSMFFTIVCQKSYLYQKWPSAVAVPILAT